MTPKQEALNLIDRFGAELQDLSRDRFSLDVNVWAPAGSIWHASSCHVVSVCFHTDRAAGWRALVQDLRSGVGPCRTPDCETCNLD